MDLYCSPYITHYDSFHFPFHSFSTLSPKPFSVPFSHSQLGQVKVGGLRPDLDRTHGRLSGGAGVKELDQSYHAMNLQSKNGTFVMFM